MVDLETSERSSRVQLSVTQLEWEKKQFEKWLWTNASVDRRKSKIFWEDEKPYCTLPDLGSFVLEWEGWLARAELQRTGQSHEKANV